MSYAPRAWSRTTEPGAVGLASGRTVELRVPGTCGRSTAWIAASNILAAPLGLWLFVLAMGTVAFAVGAATGRRATALGVGSGLAVGSSVAHAIGPMAEGAEWLETVSPFSWYAGGDPLSNGADVGGFGALVLLALVALGVGLAALDRRDLGV